MRKLVSIQTIDKLEPIPNADKIELATILGWKCVVKKGQFQVGDDVVFFEVDSFLPVIPLFSFLEKGNSPKTMNVEGEEKKGYRLKTVRLRGVLSQGLVISLAEVSPYSSQALSQFDTGQDITEFLGVLKYEAPVSAHLAGKIRGMFPSYIPKTDETRIQTFPHILEKYKDVQFYCTEKFDGSSVTMFYKKNKDLPGEPNEFHVCSRNLDLMEDYENTFWKTAKEMGFPEIIAKMPEGTVLQGELVGEGVQKNPKKIKGHKIYIFNIFNYITRKYLDLEEFSSLAEKYNFPTVLIVGEAPLETFGKTIDEIVDKFKTSFFAIEGYVFRPTKEMTDENLGRLSFKVINPEYLLKYEE